MNINYLRASEYQIPEFTIPKEMPISKYGMLHKHYLKEVKPVLYQGMLLEGTLMEYLHGIEREAKELYEETMESLLRANPAPEKALGSLVWAKHMETLSRIADEIVMTEVIYR